MNNKRTCVQFTVVFILLGVFAAGCGGSASATPSRTPETGQPVATTATMGRSSTPTAAFTKTAIPIKTRSSTQTKTATPAFGPTSDSPFSAYISPPLPVFAVARLGKGALSGAAVSPSGEDLAVATPIGVYLYRMEPAGNLREMWFAPTTIPMTTVAFSPDGKTLACGSYNGLFYESDPLPAGTVVMLLETSTGTPLRVFPIAEPGSETTSLAYSADGEALAAGYETSMAEAGITNMGVAILDLLQGTIQTVEFPVWDPDDPYLPGRINGLAFSPDGSALAVALGKVRSESEMDENVVLLNPATGERIRALTGYKEGLRALAFSPNGETLATVDPRGTVDLWDAARWEKTRTLTTGNGEIKKADHSCRGAESARIEFSADGRVVSAGMSDGRIHQWNAGTGSKIRILSGQTSGILALAYSADGAGLTSVSFDRSVIRYKPSSGEKSGGYSLDEHAQMSSVAFSPDRKTLAGAETCGGIRVWDVATRKFVHTFGSGPFAYSPDGSTLATGNADHSIILWDTSPWKQKTVLRGHTDSIDSVAFSPDGKTLASGGSDKSLILWDAATGGKRWAVGGLDDYVMNIAFSPDGNTLAHTVGSPSDVYFRNPATGGLTGTLGEDFWAVFRMVYSPDGKYLAVVSYSSMVTVYNLPGLDSPHNPDGGWDAAFSPDGSVGASGSVDIYYNVVHLWDPSSGKLYTTLPGHTQIVTGVSFSPDGKTVASASLDGTILIWDVDSALGR